MQLEGNTVLITGGGTGIGRGLAEQFHARGNQVVIAARREEPLKATCAANPGMAYFKVDVTDPESVGSVSAQIIAEYPDLNCVINNAGIQRSHDFSAQSPPDEELMQQEMNTNFMGLVRVTSAFLAHLRAKPRATLINVSSGLALVPLSRFPVYCASKAAMHSLTLSLRHQLRGTNVRVIELVPPAVASDLRPETNAAISAVFYMPLDEFIATIMGQLATDADEVAAGTAERSLAAVNAAIGPIYARMNPT